MSDPKVKSVTYPNLQWESAGDLIFPDNFDEKKKYATILAAHPIGSCKEQTAGNVYGYALAKAGYLVFAFDASFQGASGGDIRFIEDPAFRVSDFRFAIDYLVTLPYVDKDRIGALGVCGGGGYVVHATMTDHRIKATTSITGVNYGRLSREAFSGFDPVGTMEQQGEERTKEAQGAERVISQLLPNSVDEAKKAGQTDRDILEATDYYRTSRGKKPHGAVSNLGSFNSAAMGWDAYNHIEVLLSQPCMWVVGELPGQFGAYRDSLEAYGRANNSKDRQLVVLPNTSHYDLYDKAAPKALEKCVPFFKKHLGENK